MTTHLNPRAEVVAADSGAAECELVAAARMMLQRMGVAPADLMSDPVERPRVPTFAEYIPLVEEAVSTGTARTYGSYWNRIRAKWGSRNLLEPTSTEIKQFAEEIKAGAVQRPVPTRPQRGGRHHRHEIGQLQRQRMVDAEPPLRAGVDHHAHLHDEHRHRHDPLDVACSRGVAEPVARDHQRRRTRHEHEQNHEMRRAVGGELPRCRELHNLRG